MKTQLCCFALLLAFGPVQAQQPQHPVARPDLVCSVKKSGNALLVAVSNGPDARESAACKASVTFGGTTQEFAVPRLGPGGEYEKSIPIPAALLAAPILVKVKADSNNSVPESNEGNNSCTRTLNRPDLAPVLEEGSGDLATRTDSRFRYFSVANLGDGDAPASTTIFSYGKGDKASYQPIPIATPAIPAGGSVELQVSPKFCTQLESNGDCLWTVVVNFKNTVPESDESNNKAKGGQIN